MPGLDPGICRIAGPSANAGIRPHPRMRTFVRWPGNDDQLQLFG
jgi:hypothetical protein